MRVLGGMDGWLVGSCEVYWLRARGGGGHSDILNNSQVTTGRSMNRIGILGCKVISWEHCFLNEQTVAEYKDLGKDGLVIQGLNAVAKRQTVASNSTLVKATRSSMVNSSRATGTISGSLS